MKPLFRQIASASIVILTLGLASPVQASAPVACTKVLSGAQNGQSALNNLKNNVAAVASLNGKSEAQLRSLLLSDSTFWLDECGFAFYVEPTPKVTSSTTTVSAAPFAYDQTFKLHSKLGSTKTIYLDFTGYTFNNAWNSYFGVSAPYTASGYSQDADFTTFTTAEMDVIQYVWQRVSEDYAPFDVDVTTEEPALGVLERDNVSDNIYGTRAVITADSGMQSKCGCGGVAYVGVFDNTGTSHETYQPAWIFTKGVGTGAKNITEALSHEVGHNLGLSHDGTSTQGYYSGTAGWAPIMGVGYYQGLTQWSKGEYPNANNKEDDYVIIANNGVSFRSDEDSSSPASARALSGSATGIISTPTDTDWYSITPGVSATATFSATVAPVSPNLDLRMDLYLSSDLVNPIATSDPAMVAINSDSIGGLNASLSYAVTAGLTYFVKINGVGFGDPALTGYSDYGSVGSYTLQLSGVDANYAISGASFSPTTTSVPTGYSSGSTTSTLTLTRSGNAGSNPTASLTVNGGNWTLSNLSNVTSSLTSITSTSGAALSLSNSSGSIGLSLDAGSVTGTYTATVTVGTQTLATYSVTVQSPYVISAATASPTLSNVASGYTTGTTSTISLTRSGSSGSNPTVTLSTTGGTWTASNPANVTFNSTPSSFSFTGSITITLLNSTGSFTLTLNSGSGIGIYSANIGSPTILATYSVDVGSLPQPPTGLTCIATKKNAGSCRWDASTTPSLLRYEYRTSTGVTGPWSSWTSNSLSTTLTLNGLRTGTTYYVEVRTVNKYGASSSVGTSFKV